MFMGMIAGLAGPSGCDTDNDPAQTPAPAIRPVEPSDAPSEDSAGPAVFESKPAPRPEVVATTGPKPAAQPPASSGFRPLSDARVGEWAEYTAHQQRTIRYEVLAAAPSAIRVRLTVTQDHKALGLPATREEDPGDDPFVLRGPQAGGQRTTRRQALQAAGRTWEATCHEDRWTEEGVAYVERTWISNQAPVYGLLKMIKTGDGTVEASMELRAFGSAERG